MKYKRNVQSQPTPVRVTKPCINLQCPDFERDAWAFWPRSPARMPAGCTTPDSEDYFNDRLFNFSRLSRDQPQRIVLRRKKDSRGKPRSRTKTTRSDETIVSAPLKIVSSLTSLPTMRFITETLRPTGGVMIPAFSGRKTSSPPWLPQEEWRNKLLHRYSHRSLSSGVVRSSRGSCRLEHHRETKNVQAHRRHSRCRIRNQRRCRTSSLVGSREHSARSRTTRESVSCGRSSRTSGEARPCGQSWQA